MRPGLALTQAHELSHVLGETTPSSAAGRRWLTYRPMATRFHVLLACTLATPLGCTATDEDCAKLGDKFVELYTAELSENSKKLGPEILANAAEAGREEVVEQCKKQSYSRASVDRCLAARSMDAFKKC